MIVAGHGISIAVPDAWEVRIFRHGTAAPVLHAASFALLDGDGDFGAAATGRMRPGDGFLALVEYLIDERLRPGVGLFEHPGVPPAPALHDFGPRRLQVTRSGQLGWQGFFTAAGRPCCLYAVIAPGVSPPAPIVAELGRAISSLRLTAAA